MRRSGWIIIAATGCAGALISCSGDSGPDAGDDARAGRLHFEREGRGAARLVAAPARATYCASDSSLVIVAVDREWTGGVAMRTPWPLTGPRPFTVRSGLEGIGTASVALRSMEDSVGPALVAVSGTVRMEAAAAPTGRLDVVLEASDGSPVRVSGNFRAVPITAGCAGDRPPR